MLQANSQEGPGASWGPDAVLASGGTTAGHLGVALESLQGSRVKNPLTPSSGPCHPQQQHHLYKLLVTHIPVSDHHSPVSPELQVDSLLIEPSGKLKRKLNKPPKQIVTPTRSFVSKATVPLRKSQYPSISSRATSDLCPGNEIGLTEPS